MSHAADVAAGLAGTSVPHRITVLPAPLCLTCQQPIFDMSTSNDVLTGELTVVLRCHGDTETITVDRRTLEAASPLWPLGTLATAFEPTEPALGLAAGW